MAESADAGEEICRQRRENAELTRANGILRAASAFFAAEIDPPHWEIVEFIGAHQGNRVGADGLVWGVDSMCRVLTEHGTPIAPSTYYEHRNRGPSARMRSDSRVIDAIYIMRRKEPLARVLGSQMTWILLRSNGLDVSRCTVERGDAADGWRGCVEEDAPAYDLAESGSPTTGGPGRSALVRRPEQAVSG